MALLNSVLFGNKINPTHLFFCFHGYGSNANDMGGIASLFVENDTKLNNTLVICLNAPDLWENGINEENRQWFSLRSMEEKDIYNGLISIKEVIFNEIEFWLKKYNLSYKDIFLMGFSQGAIISLFYGLRMPEKIAGVISFSGTLIGAKNLNEELKSKPEICLIHGNEDEVLDCSYSKIANRILDSLGIKNILYIIDGLNHSIDDRSFEKAFLFVKNII